MKNKNQRNPLDAVSDTATELDEIKTMADSQPRPDEAMAEIQPQTDMAHPFLSTCIYECSGDSDPATTVIHDSQTDQ